MDMSDNAYVPGLENIIACETAISYLDVEHEEIVVRGYDLIELAENVSFIDVVGLLLHGELPDQVVRQSIVGRLQARYGFPSEIYNIITMLPSHVNMMDVLRTGISVLASFDPELDDRSIEANLRKSYCLLAVVPQLVANGYRFVMNLPIMEPRNDLSYSANFLYMITGNVPDKLEADIFDQSLIVYSEHEMPNSTFAARVIASTNSDIYGAVAGGVASLKGTLHGGANEAVMQMLLEAGSASGLRAWMYNKLDEKQRIMGFGHRVYRRKADPRALLMKNALKVLASKLNRQELFEQCVIGEQIMKQEKNLYPNLDYYAAPVYHLLGIPIPLFTPIFLAAPVYHLLGIPIPLFTPIFLAARTAGICAHVIEQHHNNRLFRPRVRYTGPRGLHPNSTD